MSATKYVHIKKRERRVQEMLAKKRNVDFFFLFLLFPTEGERMSYRDKTSKPKKSLYVSALIDNHFKTNDLEIFLCVCIMCTERIEN